MFTYAQEIIGLDEKIIELTVNQMSASKLSFTDPDFTATNTEDAIKEVNLKVEELSASQVSFTDPDFTATDVKDAIKEVDLKVEELSASKIPFTAPDFTATNTKDAIVEAKGSCGAEVSYSTSEQLVGTWINGEPLYEKTINFGALPNATSKGVNHDISNIAHIWIYDGFAENPTTHFVNQLNLSGTGSVDNQFFFAVNDTSVQCTTGTDRSAYSVCYVTLRYTKQTI